MRVFRDLLIAAMAALATTASALDALPGKPAPDFALKSAAGTNLRLSEYRGQVVLVNFWATWCGPCRQEMPALEALFTRYQRVGFTVLAVNMDESRDRARDMIADLGVSFPVLFDSDKVASRDYDVDSMPATVLIDRDGNVRHVHRGYRPGTEQVYQSEIRALLRE